MMRRHISFSSSSSTSSSSLLLLLRSTFITTSARNQSSSSSSTLTPNQWENIGIAESSSSSSNKHSSSSSQNNKSNASFPKRKSTKIDKKFVPPPPVFGFAALKPEEAAKIKEQQDRLTKQHDEARKNMRFTNNTNNNCYHPSVFSSSSSSSSRSGDNSSSTMMYDPRTTKIIRLSVKDALEEVLIEEFEQEQKQLQQQRVMRELSLKLEQQNQQQQNNANAKSNNQQQRVVIIEQPEGKPNLPLQDNSLFFGDGNIPMASTFANSSTTSAKDDQQKQRQNVPSESTSSATSASLLLRAPEDIIVALRPYLQSTGKVSFDKIPSSLVRLLVGHNGFGDEPVLRSSVGEKDKEEDGNTMMTTQFQEEILEAVTRTITPVGVLAVDRKRSVIKLKPGISQLAARIDAGIIELNGGSMKKVSFSAIWGTLTGAEKAFARDVGGLSRVALCFPSQFTFPTKDLMNVQRTSVAPGYAEYKLKMMNATTNSNDQETTTTTTASVFDQGVKDFRQVEKERKERMTTGQSLLKQGESIVMDLEEED